MFLLCPSLHRALLSSATAHVSFSIEEMKGVEFCQRDKGCHHLTTVTFCGPEWLIVNRQRVLPVRLVAVCGSGSRVFDPTASEAAFVWRLAAHSEIENEGSVAL
ncbi:hypothetical protein HPB50_000277 [Hyalomma asiaticum]|uniref:Uncharacterized protein n=1 Tax=Hyalomma asiaticum TaxID=266040 RepID=A0ACB7S4A4_HYAAI|nr:hypothetical protein HPB50_000277 [Hyalomma asiaticum]